MHFQGLKHFFVQPGLLSRYEPELNAFLEFMVWRFSIWVDKPTPGNALMNLRYRNERSYKSIMNSGKGTSEALNTCKTMVVCYRQ